MWAGEVRIPVARLTLAFIVASAFSAVGPGTTEATAFPAPNFVPQMELSYLDPSTGERRSCAEGCRRFEVPAGVELDVRIRVQNTGGDPGGDGVSWDLWFDQRKHPFPGLDISPCVNAEEDRIDFECWSALVERVDWDDWVALSADRVCVPSGPDDCDDVTLRVPMDEAFDGVRGRGIYSFAVWVDRFRVTTEADEFDNFAGPVRVKVLPPVAVDNTSAPDALVAAGSRQSMGTQSNSEAVIIGTAPQPYSVVILPASAETGFALSSQKSRGSLDFAPRYAGKVIVEVVQVGVYETMIVELRKLSTGEILAEARSKGRIEIAGEIGAAHLKDDRRFEVVVRSDQGARGTRGTIAVSYPSQALYRRSE